MRSAVIAALVGVVAAIPLTETIYNTQVLTITSCGPQVTDCPGKKVSVEVPVTTTICPESEKHTAPPVYHSTTAVVSSSSVAPPPPSKTPDVYPPPSKPVTSEAVKPSSTEAVYTSPAPPPVKESTKPAPPPETTKAVPPPPPVYESTPVAPPTGGVTSKPVVGTSAKPSGTGSTGVVPYKTTSASWSTTSSPAKYTGAASHLNAAGVMMGAGAFAALFL